MAEPKRTKAGTWRIRVYLGKDEHGKNIYHSITEKTKTAAKIKAKQIKDIVESEGKPLNITVGQAIDRYIELKSNILSPSTIKAYKAVRRNNFRLLMPVALLDLTRDKIQQAVNLESLTHSPKTVKNAHGLLTAALAVFRPELTIRTTLPKKIKKEKYIPSDEDVSRLLELTEGTCMYLPVLLAATLSLRRSEVCALSWDDVNFETNKITVRHGKVQNDKNQWIIKDPKTYTSYRTLSMPPILAAFLRQQKKEGKFIVTLSPGAISNRFLKIIQKNDFNKFTFHSLRHYNASVMLALNVPDKYAMERGGWATASVMKTIYQHTFDTESAKYDTMLAQHFNKLYHS